MQNRSFKLNSNVVLIMYILKNVCLQSHILNSTLKLFCFQCWSWVMITMCIKKKIKKSYLFDLFNLLFNDK